MPNDHYEIGELLGRGGMGQVHIARHRSGREVAVKRVRNTLSTDPVVVDRLLDEARLLRTVSHPNVVRMLDHGMGVDGMPFLVMDRAHGTPLNQLVARHGTIPHDRFAVIASQLFAGLAAIHQASVVHADLKSHNVLVDDINIVTIIDFGLARAVSEAASNGLIAGTPAYMAPEMIAGATPTVAADIYAAGTILYEMLTGSTPFSGHISTILTRQLSESVEPPSQRAPHRGISAALDRVVLRALDASPAARFQSVAELAAAFTGAVGEHAALAGGSEIFAESPTVPRLASGSVPERAVTDEVAAPTTPAMAVVSAAISAALADAQRLIERRRIPQAIEQLETTRLSLMPPIESEAPPCSDVWRIETVLAALYDSVGKQERARRMALVAYRNALRTGCPLAEGRAGILVDRLVARPRRPGRGTGR